MKLPYDVTSIGIMAALSLTRILTPVEFIIPPNSSLVGDRLKQTRLRVGDILLVNLPWSKLDDFRHNSDVIIIEDIHHTIVLKNRAHYAGIIFLTVVLTASTGILNIMVSAMAGIFLMFVTNCLQVRDAYRSLQGNILMLIAGTIALGTALEKTGASKLYAEALIHLMEGFPPGMRLGGDHPFYQHLYPAVKQQRHRGPDIARCHLYRNNHRGRPQAIYHRHLFWCQRLFCVSLGYHTNLLVYGPGGYRFIDYLKLGIPLNLMILIFGTLMIPVFWPF